LRRGQARLAYLLAGAAQDGWTMVSMKDDWKTIFKN
jgi:hypothetical protein